MDAGDELVDLVDDEDIVVGVVSRREMRAERLRHRCVFVLVRSGDGRVLVHRRSEAKDVWPGRWDLAAGGVLARGESYEDGATRELAEELGISGAVLTLLGHGRYEDADVVEVAAIFDVVWDGPVRFADGEVVEARWVTPAELVAMVAELSFVPDSVALVLAHAVPDSGP